MQNKRSTDQEIISQPGFTLIELIIVITILAILSTIAFVSFQNYSKDTRDTKRITELSQIEKGLEIYSIKNTPLPHPSEKYMTVYSGSENNTILIQGELGDEIKQLIQISNNPKNDPELNYTYTTNPNRTLYQLTAYLEKDPNVLSSNTNFIPQTYAGFDFTKRTPYTRGNYVSIFNNNHQPLQETELLSGNNTGSLDLTTPSNATTSYTLILGSDPTLVPALGIDIAHRVNDSITWSSGNAFTLNSTGTITKSIGGMDYTYNLKVVQMDDNTGHPTTAIWTTQNMRHPVNGCDQKTWINGTDVGWCGTYTGDSDNGLTYGLLYQWSAAMGGGTSLNESSSSVCSQLGGGWHLPSDAEWFQLENAAKTGSETCDSSRLGSDCDGAGWTGNKLSGIVYFLGGYRKTSGEFDQKGLIGYWWSGREYSIGNAYRYSIGTGGKVNRNYLAKAYGFSVLCVK